MKIKLRTILFVLLLFHVFGGEYFIYSFLNVRHRDIEIEGKSSHHVYIDRSIYTSNETYKVGHCSEWLFFMRGEKLYDDLKIGKRYRVKTHGWRIEGKADIYPFITKIIGELE